jgi:uncharacterized protein (TIGR03083 family)
MEPTERIAVVREGLRDMYERYAQLIEGLEDGSIPVPGSEWTIREAAVHVSGGPLRYGAVVTGDVDLSNVPVDKKVLDARMRSLIADNAETDLKRLADETRDSIEHFLKVTDGLPPDHPIAYYAGLRPTFAEMVPLLLGEPLVHGYDIAIVAGRPWPIDPRYAALVVGGYRVLSPVLFQPAAAAGLEATYRIDVPGTEPFVVRIEGADYEELPGVTYADCLISMDPVTALLTATGRLSQWPAIALGRLTFSGDRAEVGPRFFDLFVFP